MSTAGQVTTLETPDEAVIFIRTIINDDHQTTDQRRHTPVIIDADMHLSITRYLQSSAIRN